MELGSMLCANVDGRGVWGRMNTCMCMAESLRSSPETTTTLLISCTSKQNKKLGVWGKKKNASSLMGENICSFCLVFKDLQKP